MLFPYKRSRHPMQAMHGFIAYIFYNVSCRAPDEEYSLELFRGFPSLHAIVHELYQEDLAGAENRAGAFFYLRVNQIFQEFKNFDPKEIQCYRKIFKDNNNIESLCEGKNEPSLYIANLQN